VLGWVLGSSRSLNRLIAENVVMSAGAEGTDLKLIETSDWRASGRGFDFTALQNPEMKLLMQLMVSP